MRHVIFILFSPFDNEQRGRGCATRRFLLAFFPYSADHERDWPPCKVVFFGLATNTLHVRNNEKALSSIISPKRFDIFPPDWGMLRRSRCGQIFR